MKIYINDVPVSIKSDSKPPNKKFDVVINGQDDSIQIPKLKGKILIQEKSHEAIDRLLKIMTDKKYVRIKKIEIRVKNKPKAEKYLKSKFSIVKAAGGIVEKESKALLILRNDLWDIPKGKLEVGESKEEGALREVEEETGVKVALGDKICTTWHTYVRKKKYVLKKTYWYRMNCLDDTNLKPQKNEGIQKAQFMTAQEIDLALLHSYKTIGLVIKKYRKMIFA